MAFLARKYPPLEKSEEARYLARFLADSPEAYRLWLEKADVYLSLGRLNSRLLVLTGLAVYLKRESERTPIYNFFKHFLDRVLAASIILALSPILLAVAAAVKISSPGPLLFRQLRAGRFAQPFWVLKFRTMIDGADVHRIGDRPLEKRAGDPRATPVGKFLRKWKIDELPQLFNVLHGDMSIVGPRPLSLDEGASTPDRYLVRFAVKPGLTGLWQATRSNLISGDRKIRLDARYARMRNGWLDFVLVLRTFKVVLRGEESR
jgi:lipopolysaccharide/colanic/teichoic acid biosynthesis glycosyltransferase